MKRLFFGLETYGIAPDPLPPCRPTPPASRHMTLAFLGNVEEEPLLSSLENLPPPPFKISPAGLATKLLFLPKHPIRVVAWNGEQFSQEKKLCNYQRALSEWLKLPLTRQWLPHITLGRAPLSPKEWKKAFFPTPLWCSSLHLYESRPGLLYTPIWTKTLLPAIEPIDHPADLAYLIRAENEEELLWHAKLALAAAHPPLLPYLDQSRETDLVPALNHIVAKADGEIGTPIKAVSYHGEVQEKNHYLEWEMIIDV